MPSRQHHHAHPRRRVRSADITPDTGTVGTITCRYLVPLRDGCTMKIADIADAATLAFELFDFEVADGAWIMLDEHCRVTAVLLDPPPDVNFMLAWADDPDLGVECVQAILMVRRERIVVEPPSVDDVAMYETTKFMCLAKGVLLMDMIVANPHQMQSVGFVCDPDSVWH